MSRYVSFPPNGSQCWRECFQLCWCVFSVPTSGWRSSRLRYTIVIKPWSWTQTPLLHTNTEAKPRSKFTVGSGAPDKLCIWTISISLMPIFSPNPMFDHLLESSHRDDSNKWSNIGCGEEITQIEVIEVDITYLIWSSMICASRP